MNLIYSGFFSGKKDYYKILEVDYDATEEMLKLNYRKLALVSNYKLKFVHFGLVLKFD